MKPLSTHHESGGSTRLHSLRQRAEAIVRGEVSHGPLAALLWALSRGYGRGVRLRNGWLDRGLSPVRRLPVPVISVGNLTAGGTGKTPMALHLAGDLRRRGIRPAVVSRGYRGGAERGGGVVSDGERRLLGASQSGDEPHLLAERLPGVPVVVGADRFLAGMTAVSRFSPDLILLDDGFQHRRLARELDLVLLDARRPLGNGHLLPRGPLREAPSALRRADALILTRSDRGGGRPFHVPGTERIPVFRARHRPALRRIVPAGRPLGEAEAGPSASSPLEGRRIFLFSGLAHNADVLRTVRALGGRTVGTADFPDHHVFSDADRAAILRDARQAEADLLATTEKDAVRLPPDAAFPLDLAVVGVEIDFGRDADRFLSFLTRRLEAIMSPKAGRR
jgi:tetraacyldisaccharide 4'-kinase